MNKKKSVQHITAIFGKQMKDTLKNKTILIQFIMFPVLAIIMENTITLEGMPAHFFVNLFATMYIGMAPLTSMAAVIAEEKENNTLRVLFLSEVKPIEYLLGIGSYIWLFCMAGACIMGLTGAYKGKDMGAFLGIMAVGILTSLLIGAAVGTWSKGQMMATSLTVPLMLVFSFLPMLAMFNEQIAKAARFAYSGQIHMMMEKLGTKWQMSYENIGVIALNMIIAFGFFIYAYKKSGLA